MVCTQGLTPSQVTYEKKLVQGRPAQARSLIEVGPNNSVDLLKAHRTMKHIHTTCIVTKLILGARNLVNCLSLRQWIVSLNNPLPLLEEKNTTPFYLKILTSNFSLKGWKTIAASHFLSIVSIHTNTQKITTISWRP